MIRMNPCRHVTDRDHPPSQQHPSFCCFKLCKGIRRNTNRTDAIFGNNGKEGEDSIGVSTLLRNSSSSSPSPHELHVFQTLQLVTGAKVNAPSLTGCLAIACLKESGVAQTTESCHFCSKVRCCDEKELFYLWLSLVIKLEFRNAVYLGRDTEQFINLNPSFI
ncbi:hypothetical protein AVEN_158108-1 [Araneus ventricosus]|uniref:Uncharacterized protein n=1 Tax=Araneus ventricosus TaxID=182803 RepID=A0A4Y2GNG0_ARAVE|nr:hypothetical protein AVEN_158108-1 [Araneus ventricosus]